MQSQKRKRCSATCTEIRLATWASLVGRRHQSSSSYSTAYTKVSHVRSFCLGIFFDAGAEGCFMEGPSPWPMISATAAELDIRNWCQRGVRPWIYMMEITHSLLSRHKCACAEEVNRQPALQDSGKCARGGFPGTVGAQEREH